MYSHIPNAIAELIANAYDADAKVVHVKLYGKGADKRIEVVDDGTGMDFDEVNQKFLRIGRNRRHEGAAQSPGGRRATGKKGLGKLALFGIGDLIEVATKKKNLTEKISFTLDWDDLRGTQGRDYTPKFSVETSELLEQGTTIILKKLRRESAFDQEGLANSISKLFNCFSNDFRCFVSLDDGEIIEVNNDLKLKNIASQFEWDFPGYSPHVSSEFEYKSEVTGKIISTPKPLKPGLRGISLFANGRLVNTSEFYSIPESSHVFSYLVGWLNVDFVDNITEDVISTNRQSLNWELPVVASLKNFIVAAIRQVIVDWRAKRKEANKNAIAEQTKVNTDTWINSLPNEVKQDIQSIVDDVTGDTDLPTDKQTSLIETLHKLVPDYPDFHWRHIHAEVKAVAEDPYKARNYYAAFHEAAKRYSNAVYQHSKPPTELTDHSLMGFAFGPDKILRVTTKYRRPSGEDFRGSTIENIERGQRELSQGVITGCRNPVAHEEINDLRDSNLFSEKDCLDALSLLSHLFRRLHDAIDALEEAESK
jgi:uncharacterized protein (TIGR02391 family)